MKSLTTRLFRGIIVLLLFLSYQDTHSQVIEEGYLTFKYVHLTDARTGEYLTVERNENGSKLLLKPADKRNPINQIFLIRTWYDSNKKPNGYSIETGFKEWKQMLSTSRPYDKPGFPIMTWEWLSGSNQYWKFYKRGLNQYIIVNRHVKKGKGPLYIGKTKEAKEVKQTRYHQAVTWRIINAQIPVGMNITSQGGTVARLTSVNKGVIVSASYGGFLRTYNFEGAYRELEKDYAPCITGEGIGNNVEYVLDSARVPNKKRFLGHSDWRIPNVEEYKSLKSFFINKKNTGGHPVWLKGSKCNGSLFLGRFRKDNTFESRYVSRYNPSIKATIFLIRDFKVK